MNFKMSTLIGFNGVVTCLEATIETLQIIQSEEWKKFWERAVAFATRICTSRIPGQIQEYMHGFSINFIMCTLPRRLICMKLRE